MSKIYYQLVARGPYKAFGGSGIFYSRLIFSEREKARENIPAFTNKCCNSQSDDDKLYDLDEQYVKVSIVEVELSE